MVSQIPCSSQSRSRRQHVAGEGNSSGKSCQRAPLRRIHRIPSRTLRSLAGGLPPRGRGGRFGSQGRIFSHWASVSSRPYRAIGPPLALLPEFISCFRQTNHHSFITLYPVLKQVLKTQQDHFEGGSNREDTNPLRSSIFTSSSATCGKPRVREISVRAYVHFVSRQNARLPLAKPGECQWKSLRTGVSSCTRTKPARRGNRS
jgi:hypothetical protein